VLALSVLAAGLMVLASRRERPGVGRLILVLPYMVVGLFVPLIVSREQVVARAVLAGQFAWWSNFKVLAFSFGRGPLTLVDQDLVSFAMVLLLPFSPRPGKDKAGGHPLRDQLAEYGGKVIAKGIVLCGVVSLLSKNSYNRYVMDFIFCFGLYALLGIVEDGLGCISATVLNNLPVERSFQLFYASASLREFWSLRWNQHVAKLLKVVVYDPIMEGELVRKGTAKQRRRRSLGRTSLATLACFAMSGIMHEVCFAYVSGGVVTWSWLKYFSFQGFYVLAESLLHKRFGKPPKAFAIPVTLSFLLYTGEAHFFKPLRDHGIDMAIVNNIAGLLERL